MASPSYLRRVEGVPFDLYLVDILEADDSLLVRVSEELGLALNLEEMREVQRHYRGLGRPPTDVEIQSIAQPASRLSAIATSSGFPSVGLSSESNHAS